MAGKVFPLPRMKPQSIWLFCVAVGIALGGFLIHSRRVTETFYDGKSLNQWLDDLHGDSKHDAWEAVGVLGKIGPEAVPGLLDALKFKESRLRSPIIAIKEKLPPAMRSWIPTPRPGNWCHSKAADALVEIGPGAKAAIPVLMDKLVQSHYQNGHCALALCRITPVSAETVFAVSRLLESDDWRDRLTIAHCLGEFGPAAKPAVPGLLAALDRGNADLRVAATALWKIGETNVALAACLQILETEEEYHSLESVKGLGKFRQQAQPAVPILRHLLEN